MGFCRKESGSLFVKSLLILKLEKLFTTFELMKLFELKISSIFISLISILETWIDSTVDLYHLLTFLVFPLLSQNGAHTFGLVAQTTADI